MEHSPAPSASLPAFEDAVTAMGQLLREQNLPDRIVWVQRGDVVSHGKTLWVHTRPAQESLSFAQARYASGIEKGFGISIVALCRINSATACYVWFPKDEAEASAAMQPVSLKCKVPVRPPVAIGIRSRVKWCWLWLRHRYHRPGDIWLGELL